MKAGHSAPPQADGLLVKPATPAADQGERQLFRYGSRRYVPTVQRGAANSGTLAAEMPGNAPLVFLCSHSESSRPTPRRCWRSLGPPSMVPGTRFHKVNPSIQQRPKRLFGIYHSGCLSSLLMMCLLENIKFEVCWSRNEKAWV